MATTNTSCFQEQLRSTPSNALSHKATERGFRSHDGTSDVEFETERRHPLPPHLHSPTSEMRDVQWTRDGHEPVPGTAIICHFDGVQPAQRQLFLADIVYNARVLIRGNKAPGGPHPLMARLYTIIYIEPGTVALILERLHSTPLLRDIVATWVDYSEPKARFYLQQVVAALRAIQQQRFSLGVNLAAVALENVAVAMQSLDAPGGAQVQTAIVKVVDLGLTRSTAWPTEARDQYHFENHSPELLDDVPHGHARTDSWPHHDAHIAWRLGTLLYTMLFHVAPFVNPADTRGSTTEENVRTGRFAFPKAFMSKNISAGVMDLLTKCFEPLPEQRITLKGIWEHGWFKQALPHELMQEGCPGLRAHHKYLLTDEAFVDDVVDELRKAIAG